MGNTEMFKEVLEILLTTSMVLAMLALLLIFMKEQPLLSEDARLRINFLTTGMFLILLLKSVLNQKYGFSMLYFLVNGMLYWGLYRQVRKLHLSEPKSGSSMEIARAQKHEH